MRSRTARTTRWVNLGIAIAMATLAAVALYAYGSYRQEAISLVIERDRQAAALSAARIREELASFAEVLEGVARDPEIYRGDPVEQSEELHRLRSRLAVFDGGVVILDSLGRVRSAEPSRPDLIMDDWSGREFFRQLLTSTSPVFSDVGTDGPGGALVVAIGVPLLGPQDELSGTLVGMFRLGSPAVSAFYANIVRLRLGQTGTTYVLDGRGQILYDSTSDLEGQLLTMGSGFYSSMITEAGAARMEHPQGNDMVVAYAPIPGTDWILVLQDDWRTLISPANRYATILFATLLAGMGLPSLALMLLIRRRSTSLQAEQHAAMEDHVARLVQDALVPRHLPLLPGWDLRALRRGGTGRGAAFFDAVISPDGKLVIAVGKADAAGVRAGILITTVRAALRSAAQQSLPASEALARCNRLICAEARFNASLASLYAVLDPSSGEIELANAGRVPTFFSSGGALVELVPADGPLGDRPDSAYEPINLLAEPGDTLFVCDPAIVQAPNPLGQEFGVERLRHALEAAPDGDEGLVARLASDLAEFTGRRRRDPEITMIVLTRRVDAS